MITTRLFASDLLELTGSGASGRVMVQVYYLKDGGGYGVVSGVLSRAVWGMRGIYVTFEEDERTYVVPSHSNVIVVEV